MHVFRFDGELSADTQTHNTIACKDLSWRYLEYVCLYIAFYCPNFELWSLRLRLVGAMKRRHAWEDAAASSAPHLWEVGDAKEEMSESDCIDAFLLMLVDLTMSGTLSAKSVCLLSFWANRFHPCDALGAFAKGPGAPSGHYQRQLDRVIGWKQTPEHFYQLSVPVLRRHDLERSIFEMPVIPAHEAIERELV